MMKLLFLSAGVTLVGSVGLLIDAQSRTPVHRPVVQTPSSVIFAQGRVEGATPEVELRPRLAGRIVEILVREGQFVEQGQVLLRLDDDRYRREVELAAAERTLAQAQLERLLNGAHVQERAEAAALYHAKRAEFEGAELDWRRTQRLWQTRTVSQQEADNQRTLVAALRAELAAAQARYERLQSPARPDEVRIHEARIEAAKARLELARSDLERTELQAPGPGQILKIDAHLGELTGPDAAEPAIVFADTSHYRVRAFVEEMDAPRVKVGMTTRIAADGLADQELAGCVSCLSPRMSRKQLWSDEPAERYDTKTREVWIDIEQREGLVVGLRVDVVIDPQSGLSDHAESASFQDVTPAGGSPLELPSLAEARRVQP